MSWEAIPPSTRDAARLQILSQLGAVHSSRAMPETRAVARAFAAGGTDGARGPATVFATGEKLSVAQAAAVNAAYSMAQDFDDSLWMGHASHSAVFAALAAAEAEGASERECLAAIIVSNEIQGRIGGSCFLGPLNGQMWTFIHLVGAASAVARVLKLDTERTAHALAIALAQPVFALQPGFIRPSSKVLAASTPIVTGIQAAYLAREGIEGDLGILEDRRGFWKRFTFEPLPEMLGGLGDLWVTETLSFKTFPGCQYFQTALTALERIRARAGEIRYENVAAIELETTKLGYEVANFASEYGEGATAVTPTNVAFNVGVAVAAWLTAGGLGHEQFTKDWLAERASQVRGWRELIRVSHDPALTAETVRAASRIEAGKSALRSLGPARLLRVARRYAREYGSSLFSGASFGDWVRWAAGPSGGRVLDRPEEFRADRSPSAIAIPFANRVRVRFRGGHEEQEAVGVPVGAFCRVSCEGEVRRKAAGLKPEAIELRWDREIPVTQAVALLILAQ